MGLLDWEYLRDVPVLRDDIKLSGKYSLFIGPKKDNYVYAVHKETYEHNVLNGAISTWFSYVPGRTVGKHKLGAIFRKKENESTYIYAYVELSRDEYRTIVTNFRAGYYINGSHTEVANVSIDKEFSIKEQGEWAWFYIAGVQLGEYFYISVHMTDKIDNPDVNNPPYDQAVSLILYPIKTPINTGGGIGFIACSETYIGQLILDYTQIYY